MLKKKNKGKTVAHIPIMEISYLVEYLDTGYLVNNDYMEMPNGIEDPDDIAIVELKYLGVQGRNESAKVVTEISYAW